MPERRDGGRRGVAVAGHKNATNSASISEIIESPKQLPFVGAFVCMCVLMCVCVFVLVCVGSHK